MLREQTQTLPMPQGRQTRRSVWRQRKFLIGGTVFALAVGLLMYQAIASTGMYYLTVKEYKAMGQAATAQGQVRIGGKVQEGSVNWEPQTMTLRFVVEDDDGAESLPVLYRGVVPDSFKPGAEVVLEGRAAAAGGVFEAKTLLTKCASKYNPLR